jgi:NAD(P)-dependent dehydrogenase (short-subunit alcohol dehydrogenase family)
MKIENQQGEKTMNNSNKTVFITGANSGLGFEAAAQFAEIGYGTVILGTRTAAKGEKARVALVDRVGKDVFDVAVVDVAEKTSALAVSDILIQRYDQLDVLVLNAAMSNGDNPAYNSDGVEMTFASTLLGHHVLTLQLLNEGKLAPDAHIIIAGSEGARNEMPNMKVAEFDKLARSFDGNLEGMHEAIWRVQQPYKYKSMDAYVTGKVYVAWWAAELARKLPAGMSVNAVSPGSAPDTNFVRHQGLMMKMMVPFVKMMPKKMGMAGSVEQGARRYIDASSFSPATSGKFFASPPGKLVGELEVQQESHFYDEKNQAASWNMLTQLSGISLN